MIDFNAASNSDPASKEIAPLDAARNQLMRFRSGVSAMQREASEIVVADAATEARCSEMTAQAKTLAKQIIAQQDEIIGDAQRFVKSVQGFTLPFRKDLEAIEGQLKRKLGDYAYRKEMDRRKAEVAAQKATAEAQRKIDREAKKAGIEPVQLPAPVLPQETAPTRTESGTTSYVPVWDFEVEDVSMVPAKYIVVDRASVLAAIKAGVRDIPGLKIVEKLNVRTRTN
jgi:hypothetical protein